MFITKKSLPRRTFLRGMGAALALPLLDAMVPAMTARAQAVRPVRRFGAIYTPHGMLSSHWVPATTGKGFEYSQILKPLEPFRDHVTLLSGLTGGPTVLNGGHAVAPASYLAGNIQPKQTESADVYNTVTIDQFIAKAIGQDTAFPSLEVATEDFSTSIGACDTGYSCIYMNTISWGGPTAPMPMETNPRIVFERMFGGSGNPAQRLARLQENRSILDGVTQSIGAMQGGLGARDRARLRDYLDNVREIERRIQNAEAQQAATPIELESPVGPPEAFDEHVAVLFDLLAAAFQADITRVFTFMMMRDVTGRSFPHIGVSDPHHALSHEANGRGNDPTKPIKFATVNTHFVSMFAKFAEKLRSTPDGDGTLLDNSLVLFGSGMGNANDHTHSPLPTAILGGGAGQMKKLDHHIAYPPTTAMADLLLAMAQKVGVETDRFGTSTTPLDI
jgi:hypothetical protein